MSSVPAFFRRLVRKYVPVPTNTVIAGKLSRPLSLNEYELSEFDDEQLLVYIVASRRAGRDGDYRTALQLLVYRHYTSILRKVEVYLYGREYKVHADDVASEIMVEAMRAAFDTDSLGQFRSWLSTITHHRCVDFIRKNKGGSTVSSEEIDLSEPETDDLDKHELAEVLDAIKPAMPDNQSHRMVVELGVFGDEPAAKVVQLVNEAHGHNLERPMTENNVHQIISRFKSEAERAYFGEAGADVAR